MKKTLVPIALALGLVGTAQAQMTIYGLLDASYGKSVFADSIGEKADFHSGGDNGSGEGNSTTRIGLKGSTDVGSGLKANFKLETNGITSSGDVPRPSSPARPGSAFRVASAKCAWAARTRSPSRP